MIMQTFPKEFYSINNRLRRALALLIIESKIFHRNSLTILSLIIAEKTKQENTGSAVCRLRLRFFSDIPRYKSGDNQ
jgi:hypothetical protein